MGCQKIRQQLAIYRELSAAERDRLEEHLATCPSCRAILANYRAQDALLCALPVLSPSPALVEVVHAQTVGRSRRARSYSWRRAVAALSLVLCLSIAWGTVSSASGALPGDVLYPVKRGVEQVRLALSFNSAVRDQYQQRLTETRREEVRAVIRLEREARVEFQGDLEAVDADRWQVGGIEVTVSAEVWGSPPPPAGTALAVEALAARGELGATRVRLLEPELPTPEPQASPAASAQPSITPATWGPGPQPSPTPGAWGPGAQPSATPGAWGPGPQPSFTPSARGPGPQPSMTPATWGPGPQPSITPTSWGPGPQPSITPATWGPGPQPSVTPTSWGPGPQPSITATSWGPGPQSSVTPTKWGAGPQPSMTPGSSATAEPGMQPSPTSGTGGPGPGPTVTSGPGGR